MAKKYSATITGSVFALVNLILTWTYIVPIITIAPTALILENTFKRIFGNESYKIIGQATLISLIILAVSVSLIYFKLLIRARNNREAFDTGMFIGFLFIQMFLIHPLVFYLILSENWSKGNDGQILFGVVVTFPISSFGFVILGMLTDILKNKKREIIDQTLPQV